MDFLDVGSMDRDGRVVVSGTCGLRVLEIFRVVIRLMDLRVFELLDLFFEFGDLGEFGEDVGLSVFEFKEIGRWAYFGFGDHGGH
jgi:hypothetical protein